MKLLLAILLLQAAGIDQAPRAFRIGPGEYRWIPVTVKQTPTEVDCRFTVLEGGPSVHLELLPMREFRLFSRGREHETLAVSPDSKSGAFRRILDERGQYAVLVVNAPNAAPAVVSLEVGTNIDPVPSAISRELTPARRLTVILISFAIFFTTVSWSAVRLLRAVGRSR